ncbi:hypothetical protein AJ80_00869 [Polytolypa hystricis UAMH7299]|uniref:Uncharacterized protein n=1 Tax=Polytolypa hystricis (strain UAMH7299) TaxID=1447883 RepID=A0A2B7Z247_POLH7|nr:hypothetical protein AJ80_00869 [Polytolypa hystricis UAMH7299]
MQIKTVLPVLALVATAFAAPEAAKRQNLDDLNLDDIDLDDLNRGLDELKSKLPNDFTLPTTLPTDIANQIDDVRSKAGDSLDDALASVTFPPDFFQVIQTAIPASSLSAIMEAPEKWASDLASSAKDGKTPDWYVALPSSIKDFLEGPTGGAVTATQTGDSTAAPTGDADSTGTETDDAPAEQTSNPAVRPTSGVLGSFIGAAGVLGLALAL